MNAGRSSNWMHNMPRRTRLLLIACFLASSNPERTDLRQFTDSQSGRRKRQRQGTDSAALDTGAVIGGGKDAASLSISSLAARNTLPPRSFTLERLMSIYALRVSDTAANRQAPSQYGDPSLYSAVRLLTAYECVCVYDCMWQSVT